MQTASLDNLNFLRKAVADNAFVCLDGFHAVKHALRFGADVLLVVTTDAMQLRKLSASLAPDIGEQLEAKMRLVGKGDLKLLGAVQPHWTGVWGVARRPARSGETLFGSSNGNPIILLEDPRSLSNLGACIRVAAAADARGVLIFGDADPWAPAAVRGAAGLQFAVPIANSHELDDVSKKLIAIDPDGEDLQIGEIPNEAVLAFGTEREGLSDDLLARAQRRFRVPMRSGVSSLNLAVTVGIVLYLWKCRNGAAQSGKRPSS